MYIVQAFLPNGSLFFRKRWSPSLKDLKPIEQQERLSGFGEWSRFPQQLVGSMQFGTDCTRRRASVAAVGPQNEGPRWVEDGRGHS